MNNNLYAISGCGTHDAGSSIAWCAVAHDTGMSVGAAPVDFLNNAGNASDVELAMATIHGDLA